LLAVPSTAICIADELQSPEKQLSVIAASLDEWWADLKFQVSYESLEGESVDSADAAAGKFDTVLQRTSGTIAKLGSVQRCRHIYEGLPTLVPAINQLVEVSMEDYDEGSSGDVLMRHVTKDDSYGGVCWFKNAGENDLGRRMYGAGAHSADVPGPLSILQNAQLHNMLSRLKTSKVEILEDKEFMIVREERVLDRYTESRSIKFWLVPPIPIMSEFSIVQVFEDGDSAELHTMGSEFQEIGETRLPRQVLSRSRGSRTDHWLIKSWTALVPGYTVPDRKSFEVSFPKGTKIFGLSQVDDGMSINLLDLKGKMLGANVGNVDRPSISLAPGRANGLLWINVVLAALILGYVAIRGRRSAL
jgi:hypothetical protein